MNAKPAFINYNFFLQHRQTTWTVIFLVLVVETLFSIFANLVVFEHGWLNPLTRATRGLIQPGLVAYLVEIPLVFALIFKLGGLQAGDAGLKWKRVPQGLAIALAMWGLVQALGGVFQFLQSGSLSLDAFWVGTDWSRLTGIQLANTANAFFEETIFRGFFLVQAYLALSAGKAQRLSQKRIFLAVILSQVIFALGHIPNRIFKDLPPGEILFDGFQLLGIGSLYALTFLRSGNLFLVMGVHLLANVPMSLLLPQDSATLWVYILAAVVMLLWRQPPVQEMQVHDGKKPYNRAGGMAGLPIPSPHAAGRHIPGGAGSGARSDPKGATQK